MTLRQQLNQILHKYIITAIHKDAANGGITILSAELEALVQEIAREARLDGAEKLATLLKEGTRQTGSVNIEEGLAVFELTQKPPLIKPRSKHSDY